VEAFESGYESGRGAVLARRQRKEQLSDEDRQFHVQNLYKQRTSLADAIRLKGGKENPANKEAMDQLAQIDANINEVYHPDKNPGALQKDWHWLSGLIHKQKQQPAILSTTVLPGEEIAGTPEDKVDLSSHEGISLPDMGTAYRVTKALPPGVAGPQQSITVGKQKIEIPAPLLANETALSATPSTVAPKRTVVTAKPEAMTPLQRQRMKRQEDARKQAETDVAAAGLSPEQEAQSKIDLAEDFLRKHGGSLEQDERERLMSTALSSALGLPIRPDKYSPNIITTTDKSGTQHYYRMNVGTGQIEEAGLPEGETVIPKNQKVGYKMDAATGQVVDQATGKRFNYGDPKNPQEINAMFAGADKLTAMKQAFQEKMMELRGESYGHARQMAPLNVLDTANGNAPTYRTYQDMLKEPGRYVPAGEADKALAKENLMEDIAGTSQLTRQAINNLKEDFPLEMKTKIALAMKADDPHMALDNLIASGAIGALSDDQREFLIATRQLAENAMAMRSILGAGQGSDDVRRAIHDTLPTLLSPDRKMALAQLAAFDGTLARLHRGVPKVPLRTDLGGGPGATGAPKVGKSVAGIMKWYADRGQPKTDAEVVKIIEDKGYVAMRP